MPEAILLEEPPARLVAQMRAFATKRKLPVEVADMLARVPEMSTARAETLAAPLVRLHALAERSEVTTDEFMTIAAEALEDDPEISAKAFLEHCADEIQAIWATKGDRDIPRHGRPEHDRHGPLAGNSYDAGHGLRAKMIAGLTTRLDPTAETPMGRDAAQYTIPEIAMAVCQANGLKPWDGAEAVRMAAHSTSDFPLILENSLSNLVSRQLEQRQPDLLRASHEVARGDYRAGKSLTLSATGTPQEVGEGGEIKFVTADEKGEALPQIRDFASGFNLTNQALANDATAVGLLNQMGNRMVQGAVERLRQVLLAPIEANHDMADGVAMFHADHGNLAGTAAAITVASLGIARTAMRKQKGLHGELLAIEPWGLVVPAEKETEAQQVLAELRANKVAEQNPFAGSLELIIEPGLSNATAWYLLGNPGRYDGLAHAFLDGQRAPRVESRAGWTTLGMELRLVWALDARFIETASWFKNAGA